MCEVPNAMCAIEEPMSACHNSTKKNIDGHYETKAKPSTRPSNPPKCVHGKTMHEECGECKRGRMVS